MSTILELIYNLGILVSIGIIASQIGKHKKYSLYVQGLIFGIAALIGMLRPFVLAKGLNFDGRSIMISLGAVYFGPVTAIISALMAIILRIYQGGIGENMGVFVITTSAAIGIIYYYLYNYNEKKISLKQLFFMGIVVHITMIVGTLFLPFPNMVITIKNIAIPVLVFYPLVTVFIGKIMSEAEMKRQLMEELHLFRDLAKNATQGFGVFTLEGDIKYLNEAFLNFLKKDENTTFTGNNYSDFLSKDVEKKIMEEIHPKILENGKWQTELEIDIRGEKRILSQNFFIIKDESEKLIYIGDVVSDITDEKKAEEELEIALVEAEKANKSKSTFIANMSHELRTPMNGILGISEMLVKYDSENLSADQREGLELIKISGERLLALINDVLDIARIESGKLEADLKEIDFYKFLKETGGIINGLISNDNDKKDKLHFHINRSEEVPNYIISDEKLLSQILMNLLSNAFKFTNSGKISLDIYVRENKLFFEVSDTGIGIKKEDLNKMFEKFTQLNNGLTKKYQGTGLGLNICKKLVEVLNGEITIESKFQFGTVVKFYIDFIKP